MTLIELENGFKIRFDHNEVRISIDGDIIDVGARREDPSEFDTIKDPQILNSEEVIKRWKLNQK